VAVLRRLRPEHPEPPGRVIDSVFVGRCLEAATYSKLASWTTAASGSGTGPSRGRTGLPWLCASSWASVSVRSRHRARGVPAKASVGVRTCEPRITLEEEKDEKDLLDHCRGSVNAHGVRRSGRSEPTLSPRNRPPRLLPPLWRRRPRRRRRSPSASGRTRMSRSARVSRRWPTIYKQTHPNGRHRIRDL